MTFILETKLNRPHLPKRLVSRPDLIKRLSSGLSRKLTVISAPAGYGKTTLLCQWIGQINRPAAWYSIDKTDNDKVHFFTYLISAIQKIHPGVGHDSLRLFQAQSKMPSMEYILGILINDISSIKDDFLLVIDDYHLIDSKDVHNNFFYLLEHLPPRMHVVIATRSDPPIMLARLRSQAQIVELRANDLCFNKDEISSFFNHVMGLNLLISDIEKLDSRIEGWAAGLQMAALGMQGKEDISSFVQAFTGSSRYIMDYLVEEVFEGQSEDIQDFLYKTSILNRMNGPLCNTVTGQNDSQAILESLEQANLFIIPLDDHRNWYRYHHLFAELLKKRLRDTMPNEVKDLHRKASLGFEDQVLITEAIDHALKAEDYSRAEALISRIAEQLWFKGEQGILLTWIALLPKNRVAVNPGLYTILAMCVSLDGRFDEADEYLLAAEDNLGDSDKQLKGMIDAVRSYIQDYRGDYKSSEGYGKSALSILTDEHAIWRCLASCAMGDVHVQKNSHLERAAESYQEAVRCANIAGDHYCVTLAQHRLVVMYQRRGQLRKALQRIEQYISEENPWNNQSGALFLIYGELLYEMNRLGEAEEQINRSLELCLHQHHAAAIPYCRIKLAQIRLALGDNHTAFRETQQAMDLLRRSDIPPWVESFVVSWKVKYHIIRGELDLAEDVLQQRALSLEGAFTYPNVSEYLVFCRSLSAQGRTEEALELLKRLDKHLVAMDWMNLAFETRLVQSLVLQSKGRKDEAMDVLASVLALAEPEGYMRLFVDEGEPGKELLQGATRRDIHSEYVNKILFEMDHQHAWKKQANRTDQTRIMEELSERELQVLRLLRTPLSSTEIGQELFISSNTVRTHIKSIYAKLDVHNRREAIDKGQELGLV